MHTNFFFSEKETLVPIIKSLRGCRLSYNVAMSTTHLVVGAPRRTLNTLLATVRGDWILGREWVSCFLKNHVSIRIFG